MKFDTMDGLEDELREALTPHPAPAGLKQRVMERRQAGRRPRQQGTVLFRVAASLTLAAVAGGAAIWAWHDREERRKGEEARRQVMIALRITGHALNHMSSQLAAHPTRPRE
ncbi:MAG: hypothetical protein WCE75_13640 [Terracidiphilus sp.]